MKSWADQYHMDYYSKIAPTDSEPTTGIQEWGRIWRRSECSKIINDIRIKNGNDMKYFITTAHHMDDHLETIFMKILRGVHITNLQGVCAHYK